METSNFYNFSNVGFSLHTVPNDVMAILKSEITDIKLDFSKGDARNNFLSGNIEREFAMPVSVSNKIVSDYILKSMLEYDNRFNYLKSADPLVANSPYAVNALWVNLQAKGEFNPNHNHSGIMSFVIWVDIPYNIEDEMNLANVKSSSAPLASCFNFVYSNILGGASTHAIPVDKTYQGKMIMFPSKLMHCVYPFYTSDEYRISISGNISFDNSHQIKS